MKQTNLGSLSVVIHIPIFSTIAIMFLLFLAGCQLIEFEQSVISVTATSTATNLIPNNQSLQGIENPRIDIYGGILNGYGDVLSEEILPQETLIAMGWEMATIEVEATIAAMPIPTNDPNLDYQSYLATSDSAFATVVSSMNLTETPAPIAVESLGLMYSPRENARATIWGNNTQTNSAWIGFVTEEKVFVQVGKIISFDDDLTYGFIGLSKPDFGQLYISENFIGNTETFRLIDVVSNRYLRIEVYEEGFQSDEHWTGGTGEMYYFDMVAEEFMSQSTAELQIPNVPLQAEATPTPPIAVTIPPAQPQHPRQP